MKKNVTHFLLLAFAFAFIGCSSDDKPDENANKIEITLQEKYETPTFTVLDIAASDAGTSAVYQWIMTKNPVDKVTDSIVGNTNSHLCRFL
jgi:hypothetical protein